MYIIAFKSYVWFRILKKLKAVKTKYYNIHLMQLLQFPNKNIVKSQEDATPGCVVSVLHIHTT